MALIPLEDNFADIINKAQRGRKITDQRLAQVAAIEMEDLLAVKGGKPIVPVIRRVARHLRLNPDALEVVALNGWYPKIPVFPRGFAMFNTPMEDITVNSYLVWDPRSKQALAFDTGADATEMIEVIRQEKLSVRAILLTHTHEDHVADIDKLSAATGAEVFSHENEPLPDRRTFKDNAHFHAGEIAAKALLTSGHSPGLTTFFITGLSWPLAVVGDALFAASMGGSAEHFEEQYRNNHSKIFTLPRDTVIAPGHGPLTTLAQEKEHNPFFA